VVLYGCVEGLLFGVGNMGIERGDIVRSTASRLNLFDFVGVDLRVTTLFLLLLLL